MKFRHFDPGTDWPGVLFGFHQYWIEVQGEDLDVIEEVGEGESKFYCHLLEALIRNFLQEEKLSLQVAEHKGKIVGIMFYRIELDWVLIVRHIWFHDDYQNSSFLRRMILSTGKIAKVLSKTYTKRQPKNINGVKKMRKLVYSDGVTDLWENIIRRRVTDNLAGGE